MTSIITWKWAGKDGNSTTPSRTVYSADDVNRTFRLIDRHLDMKARFICITDDPAGIDGGIETVDLWDDLADLPMCYRRLKVFDPKMAEVLGKRIVSIDLDSLPVRNITPLIDRREPFVIRRKGFSKRRNRKGRWNGSMWMLTIGWRPEVWFDFDYNVARTLKKTYGFNGSDQAWMSYMLRLPGYTDVGVWDEIDGVINFTKTKHGLAKSHRIVFFEGHDHPTMPHVQEKYPWIRKHMK